MKFAETKGRPAAGGPLTAHEAPSDKQGAVAEDITLSRFSGNQASATYVRCMDSKDQAIAAKLASIAVNLGTSIRCRSLFAEGIGPDGSRYNVSADGDLVIVKKVPEDLPFMEHPAWDAEVEILLRVKTESLRHDFAKERVDVEEAVTAFMKGSHCSWLSIQLEDGSLLHATASSASISVRTKHRFLPWHYMKPVRDWSIA